MTKINGIYLFCILLFGLFIVQLEGRINRLKKVVQIQQETIHLLIGTVLEMKQENKIDQPSFDYYDICPITGKEHRWSSFSMDKRQCLDCTIIESLPGMKLAY